jgi:AcrR family transcriptional regulator
MTRSSTTRQRLIQSARQLFASQGITETTTKQIAELAEVNEVTLFRQFGSKNGLLLAVLEDVEVFARLGEVLGKQAKRSKGVPHTFKHYASAQLQLLEQVPEFVRSLVGEAGHYPIENRQALGRGLTQVSRYTAQYLAAVMELEPVTTRLPVQAQASLLNCLLLGFAVLEFTSEFNGLWHDRDAFLADVVTLFVEGDRSTPVLPASGGDGEETVVADLPANLVRELLQQAKKYGLQDYTLTYVLFATGLSPSELARLERSHYINDPPHHLLQVAVGKVRQVPLNQWILGHRYGSNARNPLTIWLKSRKDDLAAMFLNGAGQPVTEADIRERWQAIAQGCLTPQGDPPTLEQAQQTWCVDMLGRGIAVEDLALLTGWDVATLQLYARRAAEKAALERVMRYDKKPGNPSS